MRGLSGRFCGQRICRFGTNSNRQRNVGPYVCEWADTYQSRRTFLGVRKDCQTATLQVGPNERLTNATVTVLPGGGGYFTWNSGPDYSQDCRTVTATIRGWDGPATAELKAQIERQTDVQQKQTASLQIKGNPFTFSVPRNATNARFTMAYRNLLLTTRGRPNSRVTSRHFAIEAPLP
jgi:hypothetical protein